MQPRRERTRAGAWAVLFLVASAAQLPLVAVYHKSAMQDRHEVVRKRKRVVSVTVSPRQRPRPKVEEKKPDPEQPKGQVVTVRQPEQEVPPPRKTRYLAEHDNRVNKQQKARPNRRSRQRRLGAAAPEKVSKVQSPRSKSRKVSASPKVAEKQQPAAKPIKAAEADRGDTKPQTDMLRSNSAKALLPTLDSQSAIANLQALTGASASDDALLEVRDEGEETLLNTRKFKHWDFFDTVKRRVRRHWNPAEVYMRHDPTGKVYGIKDRLTLVQVTLNPQGKLVRLQTVKDSGVDFLDSEALEALRKAAPFRNPPEGLISQDSIVFQFGFLFEISSRRFKFFRVPM